MIDLHLDKITIEDLSGEQKELAALLGMETYIKLVSLCGGSNIYIAKADKLQVALRDKKIADEFDGENYYKLALKYNLSERSIREIINKQRGDPKQCNILELLND